MKSPYSKPKCFRSVGLDRYASWLVVVERCGGFCTGVERGGFPRMSEMETIFLVLQREKEVVCFQSLGRAKGFSVKEESCCWMDEKS